jgi:fermentation-respiration switch protein FrsA (DUF1100 family)
LIAEWQMMRRWRRKQELRQVVEHRLLSIPGAEHGLAGTDPKVSAHAYRKAVTFLEQRLK